MHVLYDLPVLTVHFCSEIASCTCLTSDIKCSYLLRSLKKTIVWLMSDEESVFLSVYTINKNRRHSVLFIYAYSYTKMNSVINISTNKDIYYMCNN